jgi:RNA-binding protein 39
MTGQRLLGIPIIVQITEAEKNRQARIDAQAAYFPCHRTLTNGSHTGASKEAPIHRLYIGNIHFSLTEDDIKAVFAPFGEIEQVQLQKEHDTGRSRGYGFVQYRDAPCARLALEKLNGFELAGRAIRVGLGNDKFTNESTQAILERYDNFSGAVDIVPRATTERVGEVRGERGTSARVQSNLDDTDVAGVSFQSVSREALMKKLSRRDEPEEPYLWGVTTLMNRPQRSIPTPPSASRCVLLKNMFNPAEENGETWVKDLEEDVKLECENKYGKVFASLTHSDLQVNHIHVEEDSEGEIYIKFDKVSAGEAAIQGLNGRWFGGRMIAASPISDAVYATKFPRVRAL